MKWLHLARKHTLRSLGRYAAYTVSLSLLIFLVFLFTTLGSTPDLTAGFFSKAVLAAGFGQVNVLMLVLGGLFAAYANSFFFRRRAPELGLLSLLGLSTGSLVVWFWVEGALSAGVALALGLACGLVFSPFAFLILSALMDQAVTVRFAFRWEPVAAAAVAAGLLMVLHVAGGLALLARRRLADLFEARKTPEKPAPGHPFLGLLGIALVVLSYVLASQATLQTLGLYSLPILVSNVAGTFLAVRHALALALEFLRRRPLSRQNGVELVALAQLSFRLKKNARMLALVATLAATTICALGTAFYLYRVGGDSANEQAPLDLQADRDEPSSFAVVQALANRDPQSVRVDLDQTLVEAKVDGGFRRLLVAKASEARSWLGLQNKVLPDLAAGQVLLCFGPTPYDTSPTPQTVELDVPGTWKVVKTLGNGNNLASTLYAGGLVVLEEGDFARFQNHRERDPERSVHHLTAWKLADPQVRADAAQEVGRLSAAKPESLTPVASRLLERQQTFAVLGLVLFVASLIGLALFLAGASILSFKQLMDFEDDAPRYRMLSQLGFTDAQVGRVLGIQLGLYFGLPVVLGIVHSVFALQLLGRIMGLPIGDQTLAVCGLYLVLFGASMILVFRAGRAMVQSPSGTTA